MKRGRGEVVVPKVLCATWLTLALALGVLWPRPAFAVEEKVSQLVVADATAPPTLLDPFKVYGTQAQSLFRLIFSPLIDRDSDGRIVTPLLEKWQQVDPLVWEFRLRQGIRFHDGGELTAADVAFSLRRIVDPDVGSPRRHEFGELDKVVAVDRWTVQVVTKRPYPLLPARLSQFSMILPNQLRGRPESEFFQNPIGLGPFRLVEINREQAVLKSFPEYFEGAPRVSRVIFRFIVDPEERLRQLQEGKVDLLTNLLPRQVDLVIRARHLRLLKRHSIRITDIMIDATREPLARTDIRRALRYGTDVEGLVRYVARGNGRSLATWTLPEDFGFNSSVRPYPFDPAKARLLLSQAGYPQGFRLKGLATHDTKVVATAVAQQWAKLGVVLDVTVEGRTQATQRWIRERGQHDFWFLDPTSIMFDAAFLLRLHIDPGHPVARAPSPRALELLNRADVERDAETRAALLRETQAIVHEEALAMPLYQVVDLYGVRDKVRGFVPSADTILRLAPVTLAP